MWIFKNYTYLLLSWENLNERSAFYHFEFTTIIFTHNCSFEKELRIKNRSQILSQLHRSMLDPLKIM